MTNSEEHKTYLLNRIVKNSFFLVISRITDIGAVIITTPLIARYLGLKDFGDYALVMAITIFVKPLAEFGAESIICRDVAKNKDNASGYINAAFIIRALISGFIIVLIYLFSALTIYNPMLKHAILISSVTEIAISFITIFFAVIRAYERMEYELICNFSHKLVYIVGIAVVVLLDLGFLALFYARFFASLSFLWLATFLVFRHLIVFKKGFKWQVVRFIFKEAVPLAIFTLLITAYSKVDIFFLKFFRGSADVALFDAPNRLITQLQFIPFSVVVSMFPFFARISEDPSESFHEYYARAVKFLYVFSIFPVIITFLGSESIINLLFGEKFLPAVISLRILAWTFIVYTINHFLHNMLIILGRQRIITIIAGLSLLSNVLLDFLLIPHYGYVGASIATLVSCFILFALTIFFVSMYAGRMNASNILIKPSISALLTGVACFFIIKKSLMSLFAGVLFGLPLYISMLLMLSVFDENDLRLIKGVIFRRKKLIAPRKS